MKKLVLASAVAALSITAAQAAPTVYGKVVMTADVVDTDANDSNRTTLNTHGSRIGVKGAEALTANTDLVYQLEYRVRPDSDKENKEGRNFEPRDTFIGVSNKQYGTLLAGRLSAIDDQIDYADVTVGGVVGGDDLLVAINEPRANNAFAYISPSYNGLQFLGMYALDELEDTQSDLNNPKTDAYGVGLKYEPEAYPVRAGITYISTANIAAIDDKMSWLRVSGDYKVTPALTVGALYQNTDLATDDNENGYTLSAKYKTQTPWSVYGQLDYIDNAGGNADAEKQRALVGGEYAFNKAATGHIYTGYLKEEVKGQEDQNSFGVGAGIEYNF
ncbi:porin [Moraxella sp. FZLJ2107]|uniref:porin n=1 Tax=unclassified Moraxella TaxID=2685852 RepID=UPI0020C8DEF7|nr:MULTISPECIES: porin [unclassified Moraxella]UTO05951.1 porin [Moraxella sp. FZLJ2107]UTO22687.1 porin [Moraxella sp. FZLJ2109]